MAENKVVNHEIIKNCCHGKFPLLIGGGVLGLLLLGGILLASLGGGSGIGNPARRSITVSGSANRQQANEKANFNATVSVKNADKAAAVAEVNQKSDKLIADLKQFGIPENDLKTQSLNIYREQTPYYEDGVQKFRDGDWNASISIDITLRDVSKSSSLAELLAKSDATNVWGPNYSLSEEEPDKAELLKQAFDNAKGKADSLASGMGLKVGRVISVTEGPEFGGPVYPMRDMAMGAGGGGGGMTPGSSNVSTTLTVTFELR